MTEKDLHLLIEQQEPEAKDSLCEHLAEKYTPQVSKAEKTKGRKMGLIALCSSICACLVCVAIMLPFVLSGSAAPSDEKGRYSSEEDCVMSVLDYNISEYASGNGKKLLYLNWYNVAESFTCVYRAKDDFDDIVFMSESFVHMDTGDTVNIYIMDTRTTVDVFEHYYELCMNDYYIGNVHIKWAYDTSQSLAHFEYGDYKYFIEFLWPMEEQDVLNIAESMLQNI